MDPWKITRRIGKTTQASRNLQAMRPEIDNGLYTAAIRTLNSSGVAPYKEATLLELQAKHPYEPPPLILSTPVAHAPLVASKYLVLNKLKSFPRGTSCGRDGLRAQHLIDALGGAAAAVSDEIVTSITELVNIWLARGCPQVLGEFIASAPLTPLVKPGGGIRPIFVGTIWRCLVSKVVASHVGKAMDSYLGDYQFGVGVSCGGESIFHAVNRLLEVKGDSTSMSMLLVDFSNAFNLVSRSAMIREVKRHCPSISRWVEFFYESPARLYYMDKTLFSAQGVQHGDPLGLMLFALTLQPLIHMITERCTLDLQDWYLDDGTIVGDTLMVAKDLDIIRQEGVHLGLHLNVSKSEHFWPSVDSRGLDDGVFPPDIHRPPDGVKLLGGPVSRDPQFCRNMVAKRVQKTISLIDDVQKLKDPQGELLFLRNCYGVSRLYFAMRTTKPKFLDEAHVVFDDHLRQFLRHLVTGDRPGFGLLQQRLATLPIKDGGLVVYTMEDTKQYCYLSSCFQTRSQQGTILRHSGVSGLSPSFEHALTIFKQVCGIGDSFLCIDDIAPHSMSSLAVKYFDAVKKNIPFQFNMSKRDAALWLGIPLIENGDLSSVCGVGMDIFGDHAWHCKKGVGIKYMHDVLRDTFADICYRASISARKEVDLGLLSDDGLALCHANIFVYDRDNGYDMCLDVTVVSPFTGNWECNFVLGRAMDNIEAKKRTKYLEKCTSQKLGFGVLAFTTLGGLGSDTEEFLKRLRNYMASYDENVSIGDFLFHTMGVVLNKGIGAQLVARLPSYDCKLLVVDFFLIISPLH
ncbi:uncharacterized protein LOC113315959 [Papaver somniferum]|uniref:uncharacterized protein LOC113315959 n=1 Tax=Papaver somniferum TaxID=3469 RepID=UPI000E6FE589|nr:uncharacterized protein LOC113315959 [Papaver somniferum]